MREKLHKKNLFSERSLIFAVKIANVLLNSHLNSQLAEIIVLTLEYAQLMSQAILLYPTLYSEKYNDFESYPLISGVVYAAKLVNPSYLLAFDEDRELAATVMRIILSWLILKYCFYIFMLCTIFLDKKTSQISMKVFRWFHQTQSRVISYFASSFFFLSILAQKENDFTFLGNGKTVDLIVCIVVIFLEFLLGIIPKMRLDYVLPTKSLLASKNNTVNTITFLQKFLIQLLQALLSETSIATRWILTLMNFSATILRVYRYFTGLPLYNVKGLLFQGSLLGIVAAVHLSGLMHLILVLKGNVHEGLRFILFSWILLSFLSILLSQYLIKKLILRVLIQKNLGCELLVHKIEIVKQYMKRQRLSTKLTENNDWFYLLMTSISKNITQIFDVESHIDFFEKSKTSKFFATYLESLLTKHPKDEFIKLYLAFYYTKKLKNYSKATTLIDELQRQAGSRLYLNASFLLLEIEADLKSNYITKKSQCDLYTYAISQKEMEKLKANITKQVDLQYQVCEELLNHNPDLNKIFQSAQSAYRYKQHALKKIKILMNVIPNYHVSPLVVCAYYSLIVNQSPVDYQKLCEIYNLRTQKYQKYFRKDVLCEENLYQNNCALFVVSGQKADAGKVVHCSPSVKKVCGGDPEWYVGSKVYNKMCSPSLRPMSESFYRFLAETEAQALYNQTIQSYIFHKEGYIFEGDFYVNMHPSVKHGFLIDLFIRPKLHNRDFIIVRENGEIEGASRRICKHLGIFQPEGTGKKKFHIHQVSEELSRVNNAMNTVSTVDKDKIKYDVSINIKRQIAGNTDAQKLDPFFAEEARCLFTLYTEKGNEIMLRPAANKKDAFTSVQEENYSYFCKASSLVYDSIVLRIFNLQEIENDSQSEINELVEDVEVVSFLKEEEEGEESEGTTTVRELNIGEDEKEQGWIDFALLNSKENQKALIEGPNKMNERKKMNELKAKMTKGKVMKNTETDSLDQQQNQPTTERNGFTPVPVKIAEPASNSNSSKKSNSIGMFEAMKLALETKHHSKSFRGSVLFSIVLLIFMLIIVLELFISLDQTIKGLKFKKDIMVNAQTRGYYITNAQTGFRALYDLQEGDIELLDYGRLGSSFSRFVMVTRTFIDSLILANKNLSTSTNLLDEDSKKLLYGDNVAVVYSDSTQVMNNFQAVDTLIQASLKLLDLAGSNQHISQELFDFLNFNLMNDILIKNREISDKTVKSVQSEVDSMQTLNTHYFIYVSLNNSVLACFLCFIMWFQYKGEKSNLVQITKLGHFDIGVILEQYKSFKSSLLENYQIPSNISGEILALTVKRGVSKANKSYSSYYNSSNLQKRFLFYAIKATILPLAFVTALIISMVFTPSSIDYLNKKLNQLSFMDQIATRAAFLTTATIELPIGNGTSLIWGWPTAAVIYPMLGYLAGDREGLVSSFLSEDLLESKEINQLLFGDACQLVGQAQKLHCDILSSNALNTSMARLLGAFETLLLERTNDYVNCDKSEAALKRNRLLNYELLFGLKRVLAESSILASELLNEEFESKLETLNARKAIGLSLGLVSIWVIFCVLWLWVLKPVRESDNNFKKVLQIFPAKMILSNFALKMFLLKTSSIDINLKKNWD